MQDPNILKQAFTNYLGSTADAMEKAVSDWEVATSGDGISLDVLEDIFADLIRSLGEASKNGMAFMMEHEE